MIQSMTAFARVQTEPADGHLICEMRSINHRYLEISIYLPEALRVLEMPIREYIRQHLKRGKIEGVLRYQPQSAQKGLLSINEALVRELSQASKKIADHFHASAPIQPADILRFPGVLETKEADIQALQQDVMQLIEKTVAELMASRAREGEELKQLFLHRLDLMKAEITKVRQRLPQVLNDQRERLLKRFAEAKVELDANRLEQEMVMFAQKIDVAEEIERTETHIAEMRRVLKQGGAIGRRLDFLLQELNREANTLGSKSVDSELSHAAVEMKVLIEQIREQVQNVE